jgi:hypothetical protein
VPELRICRSLSRKHTLGALNFHRLACEEQTVPEAPVKEKMAVTPVLMGVICASVSPRASGGRANEGRPQSVGALG